MFCENCGANISDKAQMCPKCGHPVASNQVDRASNQVDKNEWLIATLLCLFLGAFGLHRFYTGNSGTAVVMLILCFVTCGLVSGVWAVIDLILLLTGHYVAGDGHTVKRL
ncbi:MAG: zinc-ribbon domain and TM2 domain-containing protein [Kiritimatiellia bacterium]